MFSFQTFRMNNPIDYYVHNTILLQSLTPLSLCLLTWLLTNSLLSSMMFAVIFFLNHQEISRVQFALPLRENFALPFWWLRMVFVTLVLKTSRKLVFLSHRQSSLILGLMLTTLSFCVVWQFSQFVLLIEAIILFGFHHFLLLRGEQCLIIASSGLVGLVGTCVVQAGNLFAFASPTSTVLSVLIAWIMLKQFYLTRMKQRSRETTSWGIMLLGKFIFQQRPSSLIQILFKCGVIGLFTGLTKLLVGNDDASHIVPFVRQKLNIWPAWNFHSALYLCSGAFQTMSLVTYWTKEIRGFSWLLPAYVFGLVGLIPPAKSSKLIITIRKYIRRCLKFLLRRKVFTPAESSQTSASRRMVMLKFWHVVMNILFGGLAWSTVRMKYLWTPHMLVVATYGIHMFFTLGSAPIAKFLSWTRRKIRSLFTRGNEIANPKQSRSDGSQAMSDSSSTTKRHWDPYEYQLSRNLPIALMILFCFSIGVQVIGNLSQRFGQLREFHDPDTVDLMKWIQNHTHPKSVFAGSMQLMAAVKLCTGRPIANHPHYEHATLRERTRKIYQIYGRRPWLEVHQMLINHSVSYIIIENSICFARSTGCAEKDIVDLDNNQFPEILMDKNATDRVHWSHPAYHLDNKKKTLLRNPPIIAVRFCALLVRLVTHQTPHRISLEQRRIGLYFTLSYHDSTFYVFKVNPIGPVE
ncbi:Dpy-19 protein 3 [Fasciola hepatica]|uniref:Dpy-19 protein 3 n=1 Tax=Fasciola hepatica TaxID=6192 RepID=A0A4E0RZT1_FASHE|nr:Dpy-19 protein 3 [Fasciola hepatica]